MAVSEAAETPETRDFGVGLGVWVVGGAVFLGLMAATLAPPIRNSDIWWHLATGRYIVETRSVPKHEVFSYTVAGRRWVTHEWLSELVFWWTYRGTGLRGLIVLRALLLTATLMVVFGAGARRLGVYAALVLTGVAAYATTRSWLERPQLFTYLGAVAFAAALSGEPPANWGAALRRFGPLVGATLVWANLHAGFVTGIMLLGLWTVGHALFGRGRPGWAVGVVGGATATAACAAVALINPNGVDLLTYPFDYLRQSVYPKYILEWQRTTFDNGPHLAGGVLVLVSLVAAGLRLRRGGGPGFVWMVVLGALVLTAKRHVPVAAVVAGPVLARGLGVLLEGRERGRRTLQRLRAGESGRPSAAALVLAGAGLVAMLAYFPWKGDFKACVAPGSVPAGCATFLAEQGYRGNILNPFNWGGYLIFTLYPQCRVAIDQRPDVYGETLVGISQRLDGGPPEWEALVEAQHPDLVVWFADSRLVGLVAGSPKWRLIYVDAVAAAFERVGRSGETGVSGTG
jgi:hypothetical protein